MLVEALLSEGGRANKTNLLAISSQLIGPWRVVILKSLHHVVRQVHLCLVSQSLPGVSVEFTTGTNELSTN